MPTDLSELSIEPLSKQLEADLNSLLGSSIKLCICNCGLEESQLAPAEKLRLSEIKNLQAKKNWLMGRAALKQVLLKAFDLDKTELQNIETTELRMPHARLSLSHCNEFAVALAAPEGSLGAGVDIEGKRKISPRSARFFLAPAESAQIDLACLEDPSARAAEYEQDLLMRLWTVKEAVFKADMQNENKTLVDYEILDLSAVSTRALRSDSEPPTCFKVASSRFGAYWLSVALKIENEDRLK